MVPKVVFVLGGPGSGKGTQCKKIAEKFGYIHLSAGELLREEINNEGSKYGRLIKEIMLRGEIVPSEITCSVLDEAIQLSRSDKFVIDGFPRNRENIETFEVILQDKVKFMFAIYLECPEGICIQRCLQRSSSGRLDDSEKILKKRIKTHKENTQYVVDYYGKLEKLHRIDSDGDEQAVFDKIKSIFERVQFIDDYFVFSVL